MVTPRALCSGSRVRTRILVIFETCPKKGPRARRAAASSAAARKLLGSASGGTREGLGRDSGGTREGLGSDWSDRERLHFFTKWAIARLIVRWKDSLRNARRVTHSVHVWDNGKHAHERTNDFAAHLAFLRRRLEVSVLEQDLRARPLRRGSALVRVSWLYGHGLLDDRRVGVHFCVFTATRFNTAGRLPSRTRKHH